MSLRLFLGLYLYASIAFAQSTYLSEIDQLLTIENLFVLPVTDNIDGIYGKPMEENIRLWLEDYHHWEQLESVTVGTLLLPKDLIENPEEVKRIANSTGADAVLASRVTKGSAGINIEMKLFLAGDGSLIAQSQSLDFGKYDLKSIQKESFKILDSLQEQIPYRGKVMSRNSAKITLSAGAIDGLKENEILNAIQVLSIERHPRFDFLVASEKEVLGRIKIQKVDERISFGTLISEKERGVVAAGTKIAPLRPVKYAASEGFKTRPEDLNEDLVDGNEVIYGKRPKEWVPVDQPSLGAVGISLGLGSYTYNQGLVGEPISADSNFYPTIHLEGEAWVTPNWAVEAYLRQGVLSFDNPRSSSTPSELNASTTSFQLQGVYNILLEKDFWGPKISALFGFSGYLTDVDSSAPISLTSTNYSGLNIGLRGSLPFGKNKRYEAGAQLQTFLFANFSESPFTSGTSDDSSIIQFHAFAYYKFKRNLQFLARFEFLSLSSDFGGIGSRNEVVTDASQQAIQIFGGIRYLF